MECARIVSPHPLCLVVLAPPLGVSEDRDARRSGKQVARYFRHLHPMLHRELAGLGLWVDSSGQSPPETAAAILAGTASAAVPAAGS